jgi:hypothetical protein
MTNESETRTTGLQITPGVNPEKSFVLSGNIPDVHDDPQKIQQLLDLLGVPKGTHVKLTTTASSVIVR